jgi:threonine efflux protein
LQIDWGVLGAFALLWLAIMPTPGPNSLLIAQLALTAHWRSVAVALAGNLLGILTYAVCSLLGLALLLATAPSLRLAIYLLGGAYLAWMGVRLVSAGLARRRSLAAQTQLDKAIEAGPGTPLVQGFVTALSNVAALFFLASIFASTGILTATVGTQLAALVVIIVGNGTYLALLAWLLQGQRARAFYARHRGAAEIGFGIIFVAFGVRVILQELYPRLVHLLS